MALTFQTVIGLEIHVQLATKSKLFCACSTDYIGARPNSNVCPVCLGQPGSLPVVNGRAVELAAMVGLALGSTVQQATRFHRKNYFYPDLSKDYQISQYDLPICAGGRLSFQDDDGVEVSVAITRAHLEEDAGKLVHPSADGRLAGARHSLVDYNRGGVPLLEIVSEPDITCPAHARRYTEEIRRLVRCLGVSDGDMESGSLRVDANISQKVSDGRWGSRVEIKNMNSLRSLERALEYEVKRQRKVLGEGGEIRQETRHWDDGEGKTRPMRSKEEAHDYRYFPDPDLPPLIVEPDRLERIVAAMPELPWQAESRLVSAYGLSDDDAKILAESAATVAYLDGCIRAGADPKRAANWIRTEVLRVLNERKIDLGTFTLEASDLASLLVLVDGGKLSTTAAKDVFDVMVRDGVSLEAAMAASGVTSGPVEGSQLETIVAKVLAENEEAVEAVRSGRDPKGKKVKFLQGLIMRETRGQADVAQVEDLLKRRLF
jgi:aspartyl-tRNA(Asn)/glutamyl-tRNA(Gln) amidotransferase subunit B